MTTYPAPTPPFIEARWKGGTQKPALIVMHSTVSATVSGGARNIAAYFAALDEDHKASAHYVVDPDEVIQCVGDHTVAYHCGYNANSIGVELCDLPVKNTAARWNDTSHQLLLTRTARLVAELCLAYNIRPYYVTAKGLKKGKKGVTTHAQMSLAYKKSTHWDPGAWPRLKFMRAVRAEIKRLKKETR